MASSFTKALSLVFMIMIFMGISSPLLGAQTLKVASIAPENSEYGKVLNRINAEWIKLSGGKVRMQIIHNGAAGGEEEVQRRIRQGTIQGGLFTSMGLAKISLPVLSLSTPLLIRNDLELKNVLHVLEKELDQYFQKEGFVSLGFARGGWVYLFSKTNNWNPEDVRQRKIAANTSDKAMFGTFEAMGYRPISVAIPDYLNGLSSGLFDTMIVSPLAALQFQWFDKANQMLDLKVAPFIGGILVDERAWNRVPGDLRPKLIQAARTVLSLELDPAVDRLESTSIQKMVENRLNKTTPTPQLTAAWAAEFQVGVDKMLATGGLDAPSVERIRTILKDFRTSGEN